MTDTERLDWLEAQIRPGGNDYCEIYLSGLRWPVRPNMTDKPFVMSQAQMYQIESNPNKFPTLHGNTLRDAIDKAITTKHTKEEKE